MGLKLLPDTGQESMTWEYSLWGSTGAETHLAAIGSVNSHLPDSGFGAWGQAQLLILTSSFV